MSRVGFEPTIPVFERAKTFQALEREASVIRPVMYLKSTRSQEAEAVPKNAV
jgi:hypothetical protein